MNWKYTLVAGASTGALLAAFVSGIFILAKLDPGSFAGLCGGFFLLAALSAVIVNQLLRKIGRLDVSLKVLIPVGFLTSIMPIFGASFGAPNSELTTLVVIVLLGTIGGVFWITPFAIWDFFKGQDNSEG